MAHTNGGVLDSSDRIQNKGRDISALFVLCDFFTCAKLFACVVRLCYNAI